MTGSGEGIDEYVGLNAWELRAHLEELWMPGMTWANYCKVWVIDHIVGGKYFDLTNPKEVKLCMNYNNLRPSFILDNHAKGCSLHGVDNILASMPQNAIVQLLRNHVKKSEETLKHVFDVEDEEVENVPREITFHGMDFRNPKGLGRKQYCNKCGLKIEDSRVGKYAYCKECHKNYMRDYRKTEKSKK